MCKRNSFNLLCFGFQIIHIIKNLLYTTQLLEAKDYFCAFDCMAWALYSTGVGPYMQLFIHAGRLLRPTLQKRAWVGYERSHNSAHAGCSVHFTNIQTDKIYRTYCGISLELLKVGIIVLKSDVKIFLIHFSQNHFYK